MSVLHRMRLRTEALLARRAPGLYRHLLGAWGRSSGMKLLISSLIGPGDIAFDIGANRGVFTALMSNLAGTTGRVHAFEPSPETVRLLHATLATRALDAANVVVNTSAVGAQDGVATLFTPREDHGQASLRTHVTGSWTGDAAVQSTDVRVTALDSYTAALGSQRVDVLKMDVEGAELPALRGFALGLRSIRPVVVCEICGAWTHAFDYAPSAVIEELRAAGYDAFYLVTDRGRLRALAPADDIDDGESRDVVAVVRALHASRVERLVR